MFVQKRCLDKKVAYILGQTSLDQKKFQRPRHGSNLVFLRTKWEGVASSRLILFLRYSLYALSPTWSPPPHYSCLLIIGKTITAAREYLCSRHSSAMYLLSILSDFEAYSNCSQAFCFYLIWVSESVQWVMFFSDLRFSGNQVTQVIQVMYVMHVVHVILVMYVIKVMQAIQIMKVIKVMQVSQVMQATLPHLTPLSRLWSYFQGQFLKLSLQTKSLYLGIISGTPVLSLAKGFPAQ